MKNLFMCLMANLNILGNITEAKLYKSGETATIECETESGVYEIAIIKKKENEENA